MNSLSQINNCCFNWDIHLAALEPLGSIIFFYNELISVREAELNLKNIVALRIII